jgi:hypothetical protein
MIAGLLDVHCEDSEDLRHVGGDTDQNVCYIPARRNVRKSAFPTVWQYKIEILIKLQGLLLHEFKENERWCGLTCSCSNGISKIRP